MKNLRNFIFILIITIIFLITACRSELSYEVSSSIEPAIEYMSDPNGGPDIPIAAYADPNGIVTSFVQNEVIIKPESQEELDAFCARYGGTVIRDNRVPVPPPELNRDYNPEDLEPTSYTVRITEFPDLDDFDSESERRGVDGKFLYSSEEGVRLMALITHEFLEGRKVLPNWIYTPGNMLHSTEEWEETTGNYNNAMDYSEFNGDTVAGSNRSTISKAWQFLSAAGYTPRSVNVAIIDSGFWLDPNGNTMQGQNDIGIDFPNHPVQYDFYEDDYIAAGPSPYACSSANCTWHGNGVASVATGFIDNQMGTAGSGGLVANPFLFRFNYMADQKTRAIRTCITWGADVVNMSFGGPCNEDCEDWNDDLDFHKYKQDAFDAGIVLVANAGNNGLEVNISDVEPCNLSGIICVGALANDSNTIQSGSWTSNWGGAVDIWAPTNIPAMPNEANPGIITTFGGTSASTPLVAGVTAMMKSLNPGLNSDMVRDILISSAWKDSTCPYVSPVGYLNAYEAVVAAAGGELPVDYFENNDTIPTADYIFPGYYKELTLNPADWDYYRFTLNDYGYITLDIEYMKPLGSIFFTLTPEDGQKPPSSSNTNIHDQGFIYSSGLCAPGSYRLLLSAYTPQYYYMNFNKLEVGLTPDQFDLLAPPNNSATTATDLTQEFESWELNLHQESDIDYFEIEVPNLCAFSQLVFKMNNADQPLNLRVSELPSLNVVFDQTGDELETSFSYDDIGKRYLCRVDGPVGRYVLTNHQESTMDWGDIFAYDPFWWLDPIGPITNILTEKEDILVLTPEFSRFQMIQLTAQGLSVALYDGNGTLLQEGSPIMGRDNNMREFKIGETLNISNVLQPQTDYLLKITRTVGTEDPVDGTEPVYPQVGYTLQSSFIQ